MAATIQDRLRQLREEAGYSQEKLAAALGVTRMTLAGYELGKRAPDSDFIVKVAQFFDCTPDYIFGVSPFKNNRHYEEWVSSVDTLTLGLSLLPSQKRKELVTALNWLLQDNYGVNALTSDKDYMIDLYIGMTVPFAHLFQEFTSVMSQADGDGDDSASALAFYQHLERDKAEILSVLNKAGSDLLQCLLQRDARWQEK